MDSPIRCQKHTTTSSPLRSPIGLRSQDPTQSPVFHSLFDAETVVLSPSSVSNLSLQSEVPTIVFGGEPIASPVNCGSSGGGCAVGKAIKWYAVRKSINGRSLIVNHWIDCEPHVKVWNVGKTEKIIPYGVEFKSFNTFEEAAGFLFE
jgi:hypothetical protein